MMRWLQRLFWLGVFGGAGYGAYQAWARRQGSASTTPSQAPTAWPPLPAKDAVGETAASTPRWVSPVNGDCPEGYPVKANDNSRIYHVPGGRFYARTVAERCYANAEDAVADGYRPAKA
jgi:hypothetical protein